MELFGDRISAFRASKYSLLSYRPLTSCDYTETLIPIKKWAAANNYSYKQAKALVKKRLLMAKKYKGKWYVAPTPEFKEDFV